MIFSPEIEEFLQKYDRIFLDERGIIKLHPDDFYKTIDNADLENFSLLKEGLPAEAIGSATAINGNRGTSVIMMQF